MTTSATGAHTTPTIELDASKRPIKAVTVFNSRKAEVVRTFTVELKEGQNVIHITSIPSCVDTDSARITGLGDAILFDVVCTVPEGHANGGLFARPASSPAIAALERKRAVLQGERNLQGHAADILVRYGQRLSTEKDHGGIGLVDTFLDGMFKRGSAALKETEELDAKIAELDRTIESERKNERGRPQLTGSVTAVIMSNKQGRVEATLTYMVTNASWSATYDLHATTENGHPSSSVSLYYRAAIQQSTGEDWRDTSISVSSATPGQWQAIPPLRAIFIRPSWHQNWVHNTANRGQSFMFAPSETSTTPGSLFGGGRNSGVPQQPERPTQASGSLFGSQPAPPVHPQQQRPLFGQPAPGFALSGPTGLFGSSNQPVDLASVHQAPAAPSTDVNLPGIASVMGGAFGSFGSATPLGATGSTGPASTAPGASANHAAQQHQVGSVDLSEEWTNVGMPMSTAPMSDTNTNTAADAIKGWAETKAVVSESAVSSTFRVEGNCSVPSELTPHKVAIAILKFDAKLNYVSVPRSSPNAFLQGEIVNTSEYRLLPGTVNVYLDNSPVSKVLIPDVNPDESFKCTFGPDPSIRVKYTRLPRSVKKANSQFAAETSVATFKLRTAIQNKHTFPITGLIVRDAVPTIDSSSAAVASNNILKVILKLPEGLGEAEVGEMVDVDVNEGEKGKGNSKVKAHWVDDVARKEGKYEWVADIGAGEEVKLDAEFDVRAPSDSNWVLVEDAYVC